MLEYWVSNPYLLYFAVIILSAALSVLGKLYINLMKKHYETSLGIINHTLSGLNKSVSDQNLRHEAWLLNLDQRLTFVEGLVGRYHGRRNDDHNIEFKREV